MANGAICYGVSRVADWTGRFEVLVAMKNNDPWVWTGNLEVTDDFTAVTERWGPGFARRAREGGQGITVAQT